MLRILCLNTWNESTDRKERTALLMHSIERLEIDILCLQEVVDRLYEELKRSLPEFYFWRTDELLIVSRFDFYKKRVLRIGATSMQICLLRPNPSKRHLDLVIGNFHMTKEKHGCTFQIDRMFNKANKIARDNILLMGDANNSNVGAPEDWTSQVSGPTWPSFRSYNKFIKPVQLDWIFTKLTTYSVTGAHIMERVHLSDHSGLLLELKRDPSKN